MDLLVCDLPYGVKHGSAPGRGCARPRTRAAAGERPARLARPAPARSGGRLRVEPSGAAAAAARRAGGGRGLRAAGRRSRRRSCTPSTARSPGTCWSSPARPDAVSRHGRFAPGRTAHRARGTPTGGAGPPRLRERRRGSPRGRCCRSRAVRAREQLRTTHAIAALGALGWLAVGGAASLGAGAIHAAAIGVHSEHRQAVIAFTIVAAIQLGWGALVLARPGRIVVALGALANAAIFGGWVLAKTSGISFIDGLGEAESPQLADSLAAGLAVVAVLAAVCQLFSWGSRALKGSPILTGVSRDRDRVAGGAGDDLGRQPQPRRRARRGRRGRPRPRGGGTTEAAHTDAVVPPKAYDPTLPLDLSGVEGVTPAAAGGGREPPRRHASPTCRSSPTRPSPRAWASCPSGTASSATSTT